MTVDRCRYYFTVLLLYCKCCAVYSTAGIWVNGCICFVLICVFVCQWEKEKDVWKSDCKQMCIRACVSIRQVFRVFSQAPLSLHKYVCLSRSQPLRVWVCVTVSVCLGKSKRTTERKSGWWEMAESEETERDWSRGVMVVAVYPVCYLARGLHNFPVSLCSAVPWALNLLCAAQAHFVSTCRWPR